MADLDEISRSIGRLQGQSEIMSGEIGKLRSTMHDVNNQMHVIIGLTDRVTRMEPHIEDWKRMKQRGLGVVGTVAVAGGFIGAWVKSKLGL